LTLAQALADLQALTVRLRNECPWDREQTTRTIVPHTVEEAYEVADAALAGDDAKLVDELGDLLYQTYFLALLPAERGSGDLETVARGAHDKLVRRHPHVFGEAASPGTPARVKERWEELKAEQEARAGVFHDLPETLPALLYARKAQRRAATAGFDFPGLPDLLALLDEEVGELRAAAEEGGEPPAETEPDARLVDEVGDVLFTAVGVARRLNVDPELALRRTVQKIVRRFERAVELSEHEGGIWRTLPFAEQQRLYERAKEETG
jgi:XTP/dITP diphosphohydrolase/tetrapyrrole methylase family protein/MazG family protein/ATP diphosphatase